MRSRCSNPARDRTHSLLPAPCGRVPGLQVRSASRRRLPGLEFRSQPGSPVPVVLDRVVAVVNSHVILASDLDDEIRLSVLDPDRRRPGTAHPPARPRSAHQPRAHPAADSPGRRAGRRAPQAEVDARLTEIRKELPACVRQNCASDAGWKAFLAAHDLTRAGRSLSPLPARDSALHRAALPPGHPHLAGGDRDLLPRHTAAAVHARRTHSSARTGGAAHPGDSAPAAGQCALRRLARQSAQAGRRRSARPGP